MIAGMRLAEYLATFKLWLITRAQTWRAIALLLDELEPADVPRRRLAAVALAYLEAGDHGTAAAMVQQASDTAPAGERADETLDALRLRLAVLAEPAGEG